MSFFSSAKRLLKGAASAASAPFRRIKADKVAETQADIDRKLRQLHPKVLLRRAMKAEIKRRGLSGSERRQFRKNFQATFKVGTDAVTGRLALVRK